MHLKFEHVFVLAVHLQSRYQFLIQPEIQQLTRTDAGSGPP